MEHPGQVCVDLVNAAVTLVGPATLGRSADDMHVR